MADYGLIFWGDEENCVILGTLSKNLKHLTNVQLIPENESEEYREEIPNKTKVGIYELRWYPIENSGGLASLVTQYVGLFGCYRSDNKEPMPAYQLLMQMTEVGKSFKPMVSKAIKDHKKSIRQANGKNKK